MPHKAYIVSMSKIEKEKMMNEKITTKNGTSVEIWIAKGRGVDPDWYSVNVARESGWYEVENGRQALERSYRHTWEIGRNENAATAKYNEIVKRWMGK